MEWVSLRSLVFFALTGKVSQVCEPTECRGVKHYLHHQKIKLDQLDIYKYNWSHQTHAKLLRDLANTIARLSCAISQRFWHLRKVLASCRKRQMSYPFWRKDFPRGNQCTAAGESAQSHYLRKSVVNTPRKHFSHMKDNKVEKAANHTW